MTFDAVRVLEATYAIDQPERAWLSGVVEAIRPAIEDGLGMAAYIYDASARPLAVREPILDCPLDAQGLSVLMSGSSEDYVRGAWLAKVAATASETAGFAEHPGVAQVFHPVGIRDVMVINALDPLGIGCLVGAPLRRLRTLTEHERERWERVGAHLQAALRLRLRLATPEASKEADASGKVEAVLTRDSKIEHIEASARGAEESLKQAVVDIERARRTLRKKPDRALGSWRTLVRARWTLVHDFEAAGDRYIVARSNGPSANGPPMLSARERQVLGCLAMGHSLKVIAYELGLSHSTIRVLLARARAKLGAKDRVELIEKFRANSR